MSLQNITFETGDILLFSSQNSFFGSLVEYFTHSSYSHIGVILKDPFFIDNSLKGLYLWQSGWEDFPDSEDHKLKFGVQVSQLSKVFDECAAQNSKLYYRKLKSQIEFSQDTLKNIHDIVHNKPYDIIPKDWLEALERKDYNPQKTDRFWCSALVGFIYTKLNLLPQNTDWSILRPSDFFFLQLSTTSKLLLT